MTDQTPPDPEPAHTAARSPAPAERAFAGPVSSSSPEATAVSPSPARSVHDETAPSGAAGRALRITVARSGGVAGMSPRWSVEASEESDVDSWLSLVESCPWDAPGPGGCGASGADRFVYTIRVLVDAPDEPEVEHGARVPEQELDGPWRDLVDRVKDASRR